MKHFMIGAALGVAILFCLVLVAPLLLSLLSPIGRIIQWYWSLWS